MRIAIVTHNVARGDGQGRVCLELVRHALAAGHAVVVLADRVDAEVMDLGAEWVPVHPRPARPTLLKVASFSRRADRALAGLQPAPDVVIAHGAVLARARHDVNVAHFVHGAWARSPVHTARLRGGLYGAYQRLYTALNARWERDAFGRAGVVVAVSDRVRGELASIGVAPDRVRVIPNGVDPEEFRPGTESRTKLGLPEGVPLALFVGDIRTPLKNVGGVLEAVAQVPGLHVAVAGGVEGSPAPAHAARLGLADRVHFLGYRRDVPALLRAADLLVHPSRYETFSLVVLEAMASGLPVVTAATVGAAPLVAEAGGVVLGSPDDGAALVAALAGLAHEPARRRQLGLRARAVAETNSWAAMAASYLQLVAEQPLPGSS